MPIRYARICPNKNGWQRPDNENKGSQATTFPGKFGFGFEEWLGRFDWIWNGPRFQWMEAGVQYHCGFIQAFKKQPEQAIHNVEFFIIDENSNRILVGQINGCRRLSATELVTVFNIYNSSGWLTLMQTELNLANQNAMQKYRAVQYRNQLANMGNAPQEIFNVCFRVKDFDIINPLQIRRYFHQRYSNLYR